MYRVDHSWDPETMCYVDIDQSLKQDGASCLHGYRAWGPTQKQAEITSFVHNIVSHFGYGHKYRRNL